MWERHTRGIDSGLWRSPNANDWRNQGCSEQIYLVDQVRPSQVTNEKKLKAMKLPTPQQRDWKGKSQRANFQDDNRDCLPNVVASGQLSPDWVEWLMMFPIGWTSLDPMTEMVWLDWSVDPADLEVPEKWPTHKAGQCGMTAVCSDRPREKTTHLTMQVHLRGREGTGPIPRVATGIKDRVNRLKALGNGQVPLCAAVAWEVLKPRE